MKYSVVIQPEAEADLKEAFQWYQEQEYGLGIEFLRCIDAMISLILRNPKAFIIKHKKVRRALIRRFPYGIFYLLKEKEIIILAVFHVRQHPKRWEKRT